MYRKVVLAIIITLGVELLVNPALVSAQSDLHGTWKIVEASGFNTIQGDWKVDTVQPSLYIFVDGYYSIIQVNGSESRPLMPEGTTWATMTEDQLRSVCSSNAFTANSGTYEINGTSVTTRPSVAKWPNYMEGGSTTYSYGLDNGILSLFTEGEGYNFSLKLSRLR